MRETLARALELAEIAPYRELTSRGSAEIAEYLDRAQSKESGNAGVSSSEESDRATSVATEREALALARIGQGGFRERVVEKWQGACAVTGCSEVGLLVAAHIVPWAEASDAERLDADNGLLLTPNLDKLFDQHLVTFSRAGEMLVSPALSDGARLALGVAGMQRLRAVQPRTAAYRERHRELSLQMWKSRQR